jgi:acyl-CoA synthetase (AMP-forming)/AMP-acid ligase II
MSGPPTDMGCLSRALANAVRQSPDRLALMDHEGALTLAEVWVQAGQLSEQLVSSFQSNDETVALLLRFSLPSAIWLIALIRMCGQACVIDADQPLASQLRAISEARASIVAGAVDDVLRVTNASGERGSQPPIRHAAGMCTATLTPRTQPLTAAVESTLVFFTSGTSGAPKGVVHTQFSLLFAVFSTLALRSEALGKRLPRPTVPDSLIAAVHSCASDARDLPLTFLGCLPLSTIAGFSMLMRSLVAGDTFVIAGPFDAGHTLDIIKSRRVTSVGVSPLMAQLVLRTQIRRPRLIDSLINIGIGAGPVPKDLVAAIEDTFNCLAFVGYGMTETGGVVAIGRPGERRELRSTTIGTAVPGASVSVLDPKQRSVQPGEQGELVVTTPAMMLGYLSDDLSTSDGRSSIGAFHTGDRALIRNDGRVELHGRLSELIIRGGRNIDPVAIEQVLESHKSVRLACVFGLPSRVAGEEDICAIVEPRGTIEIRQLRSHCVATLGRGQAPTRYAVGSLPRTAAGDVQRSEARRRFESLFRDRVASENDQPK